MNEDVKPLMLDTPVKEKNSSVNGEYHSKEDGMKAEIAMLSNKFIMANIPVIYAKSYHIDVVLSMTVQEFIEYTKSKNSNVFIAEDGLYIKMAFILNGKLVGIVKPSKAAPNGVVDL